jgi:hypothetical protein
MLAQVVINIHLSNHNTRFHATFVEQHHTRMRPCSALFPDILPNEYICHELGRPMVRIKKRRLSCTLHLWKSDIPIHKTLLRNWLARYIEDIKNDVGFVFNHPIPHGLMSYLRYLCLLAHSRVQHLLCCVFGLFVFVLCTLWYQFLWTVEFWLPLCGIL